MTVTVKRCRYGNIANYTVVLGPFWDPEFFTLQVILPQQGE
jgi:hypothetical protein